MTAELQKLAVENTFDDDVSSVGAEVTTIDGSLFDSYDDDAEDDLEITGTSAQSLDHVLQRELTAFSLRLKD